MWTIAIWRISKWLMDEQCSRHWYFLLLSSKVTIEFNGGSPEVTLISIIYTILYLLGKNWPIDAIYMLLTIKAVLYDLPLASLFQYLFHFFKK